MSQSQLSQSSVLLAWRKVTWALSTWAILTNSLQGAPRTWIGGNADWDSLNANWNPADEPDPADEAIFNTPNSVNLANALEEVAALTMSGGISLNTNGNDINVQGLMQLTGAGTDVTVEGVGSSLTADTITLNTDSDVILNGGTITMLEDVASGLFDINATTALRGTGTIHLNDLLGATTTLLSNDGTLSASHIGIVILGPLPPAGTLTIEVADDQDARIDLDGAGGAGVVNAFGNQSLVINATLSDSFNGDMNLFQDSTIQIRDPWTMQGGTIDVASGVIDRAFPLIDTPAGVSHLAGGALTQTGGTITNIDADGTLQLDAALTQSGGSIVNNGELIFNASAVIGTGGSVLMPTSTSSLTVNAGVVVTVNQANFNLDGNGTSTNHTTINTGGKLDLNLGSGADDIFSSMITVNGGTLDVTTLDADWRIDSTTVTLSNTAGNSAVVTGNLLELGGDFGAADSVLLVNGTGRSDISTTNVTFSSDAAVHIVGGASLRTGATIFNSVNGLQNAVFDGAGTWYMAGTNTFAENTTINMVGGTVDLDNSIDAFVLGGNDTFVNANVTINAASIASYGKAFLAIASEINIAASRTLTVNLDNPSGSWTVNSAGIVNYNGNIGLVETFLAGSDLNLSGTLNVTGDGQSSAQLDIGGTVNVLSNGRRFRLGGGTLADPNRLSNGTITGPGILSANAGVGLHGFGLIQTDIDFDGSASLLADNGTLTIAGSFIDVGTLGTADADGVLHVNNPWNTNNADAVVLQGGRLEGAAINNGLAAGIDGFGTIAASVTNSTRIDASGGVLLMDNNNNDYDGAGAGVLHAASLATLEVRDNASQSFTGTVQVDSGATVFANGFELDFAAASTIALTKGHYRSTDGTDLRGNINALGGVSTLSAPVLRFQPGSNTTLTGDLQLDSSSSQIVLGANFSGGGALINVPTRQLVLADGVNLPVLIENQGTLELGIGTANQVSATNFQQTSTGQLHIDLGGTGLNDFDFMTLSGQAKLDGSLDVDRILGFNPALGDSFTILSAPGGISGTFSTVFSPPLGAGLVMHVVYNPTNVMLQIAQNTLACDLNGDGAADAADAGIMFGNWNNAGVGDCNADGIVDAADAGILFAEWTGDPTPTAQAVPEPSAIGSCLLLAGLGCSTVRRKRQR